MKKKYEDNKNKKKEKRKTNQKDKKKPYFFLTYDLPGSNT